ncbi:MAG: DUF4405 domain-containing protein [Selenomonadaceae bacterium]|nr:DUF4405 domain-containing protein [Selenomonadaceae bacterium]
MLKNFWLDVALFVSGIICIVTGVMLDFHLLPSGDMDIRRLVRKIHTYSGYVMAVALIFHVAWHGGWLKAAAKQIFTKN